MILMASLAACERQPPPTLADVPGTYQGNETARKLGIDDRFVLRSNGTFSQRVVVDGVTYTTEGTWLLDKNDPMRVVLNGMLVSVESRTKRIVPPKKWTHKTGLWVTSPRAERVDGKTVMHEPLRSIVFNYDQVWGIDRVGPPSE